MDTILQLRCYLPQTRMKEILNGLYVTSYLNSLLIFIFFSWRTVILSLSWFCAIDYAYTYLIFSTFPCWIASYFLRTFFKFVQTILNSRPLLQSACGPSQPEVVCRFNKQTLNASIQDFNENIEWTQDRAPWNSTQYKNFPVWQLTIDSCSLIT